MTAPMKRAGFAQGIYEISKTKKERIGALRILSDNITKTKATVHKLANHGSDVEYK